MKHIILTYTSTPSTQPITPHDTSLKISPRQGYDLGIGSLSISLDPISSDQHGLIDLSQLDRECMPFTDIHPSLKGEWQPEYHPLNRLWVSRQNRLVLASRDEQKKNSKIPKHAENIEDPEQVIGLVVAKRYGIDTLESIYPLFPNNLPAEPYYFREARPSTKARANLAVVLFYER